MAEQEIMQEDEVIDQMADLEEKKSDLKIFDLYDLSKITIEHMTKLNKYFNSFGLVINYEINIDFKLSP